MPAPTLLGDGGRNILVGRGLQTQIFRSRGIFLCARIFDNLKLSTQPANRWQARAFWTQQQRLHARSSPP